MNISFNKNISFSGIKGTAIKKDGTEIKFETSTHDAYAEVIRDSQNNLFLGVNESKDNIIMRSLIIEQKEPDLCLFRIGKAKSPGFYDTIEIQNVVFDKIDNNSYLNVDTVKKGDVKITDLNNSDLDLNNSEIEIEDAVNSRIKIKNAINSRIEIKNAVDSKINDYNISGNNLNIKLY